MSCAHPATPAQADAGATYPPGADPFEEEWGSGGCVAARQAARQIETCFGCFRTVVSFPESIATDPCFRFTHSCIYS